MTYQATFERYHTQLWDTMAVHLAQPLPCFGEGQLPGIETTHRALCLDYPERGGKYLRALLLLLALEAMGHDAEEGLITAAALELAQNWLLIHDDIEDDSPLRRGAPTLHQQAGIPLAINAGDALHIRMWQLLRQNELKLGAAKTLAIIDEFGQMLYRTTVGQSAELQLTTTDPTALTATQCYYIMDGKTGYYTFAGPLRLAMLIAAQEPNCPQLFDALTQINQLGIYLGRAFQLTDDLLDVTSTFAGQKQLGNDIYEGKRTLLFFHLLQAATPTEQQRIAAIIQQPRHATKAEEVDWIIECMHHYGTIAQVKAEAKEWRNRALATLASLPWATNQTQPAIELQQLIDFAITRQA